MQISVQSDPFDFGALAQEFADGHTHMGAVVTFTGIVRDDDLGGLDVMEIEHYPGMTERAITKFAAYAKDRWDLGDVLVIHRHGALKPGELIMMVATAARHRVNAFEAAEYLMDYLKSRAPFWKKEYVNGEPRWVNAKPEDEDALSRWD